MYVHLSSNESTVTNQTSPRQTSSLLLCLSQLGSGPYQVGRIWSRVRVSASFQKNFPPNYVIRQKKEESPGGLSGLGHFFFSCACQETKLVSQETASSSAECTAGIICHSALSWDRIRQCGTLSESRRKGMDTNQCL